MSNVHLHPRPCLDFYSTKDDIKLFCLCLQLNDENINWDVNYSSAFYLMVEKTSVEGQEELLVFDSEDLINGIGGALGLFLGWSMLYLGKTLNKKK